MNKKYDGGVYWLLDSRFDFLLPSFMQEFGIEKQDIVLANSYHSKSRYGWNKLYLFPQSKQSVNLKEPDDINRAFSKSLNLSRKNLVISFSGAGLPHNEKLVSLTATGEIAELCNDKWWQYNFFNKIKVVTPHTYRYGQFNEVKKDFPALLEKHKKVVIKRPCLSGGYMTKVLASDLDFQRYQHYIKQNSICQPFLVSEYIPHQQSFAGMGVVQKGGEVFGLNAITEQVLWQEVAYEGLIFPAFLNVDTKKKIRSETIKIGKELGRRGYYGFYNVDFLLGKGQPYAVEINARLTFSTILAACLYGENFWKLLQGYCTKQMVHPVKRLVIGKIKSREGKVYSDLKSYSNIEAWYKSKKGYFETLFCGTGGAELFEYGSYIGIFGEFFNMAEEREQVLHSFWEKCIKFYK